MSMQEPVARGDTDVPVTATSHHQGFNRALDQALKHLDGEKYAGQQLTVVYSIVVSQNPGGVGQYRVELVPGG